jgi:tRNA(Ile)-lysidine synthetase-like protein
MEEEFVEKINFPDEGKYIIAVSGGVDSMSLLHLMTQREGYELIVAHCNHGIREGADEDEEFAGNIAKKYGLGFRITRLNLSQNASEDEARRARYDFFNSVFEDENTDGIITAHHLDDRIETMLLNQQRGAGWLGLSPLHETNTMKRPLLEVTKRELYAYAREHDVQWQEDATNADPGYTPRNRVRQQLTHQAWQRAHRQLREYDGRRQTREKYTRAILDKTVSTGENAVTLDRTQLLMYDVSTVRDVCYLVLKERFQDLVEIDFQTVVRLEHFYKTGRDNKQLWLSKHVWVRLSPDAMVIAVAR